MYERWARGYHPPSTSATRRQLIAAGLPFCSLQATTQHLQPMQRRMSTWKRYCSPGPGRRDGIRGGSSGSRRRVIAGTPDRGVITNVTPSSAARFRRGRDTARSRTKDTIHRHDHRRGGNLLLVLERMRYGASVWWTLLGLGAGVTLVRERARCFGAARARRHTPRIRRYTDCRRRATSDLVT